MGYVEDRSLKFLYVVDDFVWLSPFGAVLVVFFFLMAYVVCDQQMLCHD